MIKNLFNIMFRVLLRNKWFSFLNIMGLAFGIACFTYIFLLLKYELEYDRFHEDVSRIYRISQKAYSTKGENIFAGCQHKFSDYILENSEHIEHMARFAPNRETQISYKENVYKDGPTQFVEQDIFKIISLPFKLGDKNTCLERPFTAVITNKAAHKYFGEENPIGKLLKIDTAYYEVTGVLETLPENTRFKLDFYLSWPTYALDHSLDEHRYGRFLHTYIKLKPEEKPELFENSIKNLPELLMAEEEKINLFIQGLSDLHITDTSNYLWDWEVPTNTTYIYILAFTGLFILILSSLNYINLSTTRYTARQREIALRKTVGASKINLIIQFIGESILLVFIAHILGMFLLELSLPSLNNITQYSLKVVYSSAQLWFYLILIILFIGVGAGSYPAFYMSSFSPILIQRGGKHSKYRTNLRTILSTIQFTISIILIIGTAMISKQVNYMKNENLGFLKERKIIIELPSGHVNDENYLQIKNEFKKFTGIEGAAISSSVPGKWRYRWRLYPSGEEETNSQMINCMQADFDYFKIYGLKIEAGKAFDEDLSREANYGYVFNEAAIKKFGWGTNEDALSKNLFERKVPVLGVMKDFHSKGLQIDIEPLGIFLISEDYRYITLQMNELANYEKTVMFLQSKFGELFPDYVFNYFFLDEEFDRQYKSEEKIAKLFKLFAFIGIFIASIGLFGMSTFICQKREKEMAIRKVNGANTSQLFFELSKDFTWIVLIAFIIAIPIAYYGTNNWLNNFAYKVGISWFLILFSGALTWIVAMLTVSYQTVKTVRKNPVDSLRIE